MSTTKQKMAMKQINDKIKQVELSKRDAQKLIKSLEQLETCIKENEEIMKEMGVLEKATKDLEEGRLLVEPLIMDLHAKKYTAIKKEYDAVKKAIENSKENALKLSLKKLQDNLEKNATTTIPRSPLNDRVLLIEKHPEFKEIFELYDVYNNKTGNLTALNDSKGTTENNTEQNDLNTSTTPVSQPKIEKETSKTTPQQKSSVQSTDKPTVKITTSHKRFQTTYTQKVGEVEKSVESRSADCIKNFEELCKKVENSINLIEDLEIKDEVETTMKTLKQNVKEILLELLHQRFDSMVKDKFENCKYAVLNGDEKNFISNLESVKKEMEKPYNYSVKATINQFRDDIIEKYPEEKANLELINEYLTNKDSLLETTIENKHLITLENKGSSILRHIQECVKAEEVDFNLKEFKNEYDSIIEKSNEVIDTESFNETFLTKKDILLQRNPNFKEIYEKYDYYSTHINDILTNLNVYEEAKKNSTFIEDNKNKFENCVENADWRYSKQYIDNIKNAFNAIVELHKSAPNYLALEKLLNDTKDKCINDIKKYLDDFDFAVSSIIEQKSSLVLKLYVALVENLIDNEEDDMILPHSKVAELTRFAYMYSLTFKDQTQQEVVNMKSMFDKVDQIITNNDYTIETIDLITSAAGCYNEMTNTCNIHYIQKSYSFGMFCRLLKELKSKGIEVESLRNEMKTKAKNDFKAPDFNYEDKFYDLCEQNTSSFIKKAENKELSMGNTLSSVKNYYQYINCDSSVHQKEFESYSLEDKFDWMTEASEEFNKASFNKVKKILSSLDTNENVIEILNNFAIVGTDSYSELQILHKFVLKFEDIMQTFEMIISTNGKKSFLQFPSLIKDFINVYNALLCIISVSMIIYIRDLMEIHETCSVYDAYNTNLVITLQNIVKTLRPFTEKFTTPTGLIHKHIEKALKPINDDIKQNLVMFKREEKTLQEIKKQIPKLLDVNDLLSLSKALSLTTFIRTYYAYDKDALELMNEVDKQCISTSNFGFIPNLLVFIRDINPLFNQTPKTDFLISPTIFTQRKFLSSDTRYANITDDYTFNIEVLLRNAYVTHSYHKLCLHKYQEHDYSGVHITSHLPCSSSLDGFCRYDGWFDKRHYDKAYEFKFGNTNELKLKYYEKFISNSIKPLYYRALLVCTHSVCPKVIPSEYTCELILPLCKFNKLEYGRSHNYTNFLLSVRDVAYNCKKDLSEKNFIAFNYHLGIEDEYNKESKDVIDTFNTNVAKFDESSESDRLERVEKLLDTYVKPYGNSVLVHNGEKYECTRTDKGFNIKVNNTSNCFLTQSTIQYKPAKNGHYMVLSFNNGECFKEDDCYKWMYYGYDAMKNDIDFGFNFDDISKVPKELAIILSHAYKMDKITTKIDAEIEADQIKREIRQREIDAQFELDRMMRSMR